jgi:hypothetical protein
VRTVANVDRLIKNREYAQSSRNKKKEFVQELEKKISDLTNEKAALQQRVNVLEMENKTLKFHMAKAIRGDSDNFVSRQKSSK